MFEEINELLTSYRATPVILPLLVRASRKNDLHNRPSANEWSAGEVICHLADTEDRALARVNRMLKEDRPVLPAYDPDQLAIDRSYQTMDIREALNRFQELRGAHVAQLEALETDLWGRTGRHETVGEISIQQLTAHMVAHDLLHLAQLAKALSVQHEGT